MDSSSIQLSKAPKLLSPTQELIHRLERVERKLDILIAALAEDEPQEAHTLDGESAGAERPANIVNDASNVPAAEAGPQWDSGPRTGDVASRRP